MTLQQQLLLDLQLDQPPTLENFVAGANAELIARLRSLTDHHHFDAVYLWGPAGCGKSHLLAATANAASAKRPVIFLPVEKVLSGDGFKSRSLDGADVTVVSGSLLVIDEIQALDEEGQRALFRLFNTARFLGLALLLSGTEPPMQLALREDLRTRIGQMLIYEIHRLSDEEKAAALAHHAQLRGMLMDPGVVQYLLRHGRRDLPSLMHMLESLDRISLEQHRPLTVPLVRELMQTTLDTVNTDLS
ncbi:MAG: DnaA regulatory inactivator Hda [Rugosibacter sp.]|nr:MAG: DnaA regulatory inactivator Hda [Rugosibacter sp.]